MVQEYYLETIADSPLMMQFTGCCSVCPIMVYDMSLITNYRRAKAEVKTAGRPEMFNAGYFRFRSKKIDPTPPMIITADTIRRTLTCSERITTPPVAAMSGTSN
jgi:hypothetical protein